MARKSTEKQLYAELLSRYGREIADAFMAAVFDLRRTADLQRIIAAISSGDFDAALAAMHLDAAAFNQMLGSISNAYGEGGQAATSYFPPLRSPLGASLTIRFNVRNPRAEGWLRSHSATMVTRILEDQRVGIRRALVEGMTRGNNPRTTALEIVGRLNRATGKREGGIIGLTSQQETFARTAGAELRSGNPADLRNYLKRELRDRRYDAAVQKAIANQKPVPAALAANAERSYRNRLLKMRGDTIGRHEALTALRASKHEAYAQAVDAGVAESTITRKWDAVGDRRVRHSHAAMDGQKVIGLTQAFRSPSGALLLYPGDTSLGAGADEIVNCRCDVRLKINHLAGLR